MTSLPVLAVCIAMFLAFWLASSEPGYSCPSCGTTRERDHAPNCSWRRFYEEDE